MKVNVQSVNFSADKKLISHIQKRLDKLEQFHDRIVDGEVFLKVDNNHTKQNKVTEIKLSMPGQDIVVKKQCSSFEEATDLSTEALKRQLKKHKEKSRMTT